MGLAELRLRLALLAALWRGASSTGSCAPTVVTSGFGCAAPVPDAATCTQVAAQHPLVQPAGPATIQEAGQAPDRPSGCWWQANNGLLWFNLQPGSSASSFCSEGNRCICCSTSATSPVTVTSISVSYAIAGTPTEITLNGAVSSGDKVAWAADCSVASPSLNPGIGGTASYTFHAEGVLKLCYQVSGSGESVEQVGIELEVVGACIPEAVTSGPSGVCQWPILTVPQCSYKASLHPDIADGAIAVLQDAYDRPSGCWWQPGNGGLYFNVPSGGVAPVACTESLVCICCLVTSTSTTSTATTVTLTTTTSSTSTTTATSVTLTSTTTSTTTTTTTSSTTSSVTTTTATSTTSRTTTTVSTTTATATTTMTTSTTVTVTTTATTTATSLTSTSTTSSTTSSSTTTSTTSTTTTTSTNTTTSSTTSRTTTTGTTSTTTTTRSDTCIRVEADVTNLDYHKLVADAPLLHAFEDSIKRTIVFEARGGAFTHMIDLVLSPGSTRVAASVYVDESEQRRAYSTLAYSQSLRSNLQSSVADVPGIAQVCSGPIGVLPPVVVQVATSCSSYVCPAGFDDRPDYDNVTCSSAECSLQDCCDEKAVAPPLQSGGTETSQAGSQVVQFVAIGFAALAVACFLLFLFIGRNRLCRQKSVGHEVEPQEALAPAREEEEERCDEAQELSEGSPTAPKDVAEPFQRTCPKGHALRSYAVPWSGDFSCDRCGVEFVVGTAVWTCEGCHYDLCNACSGGGDEELPRCPGGHFCKRFALEPGDYTYASCSRCLKGDLARSCTHFFRCGACQYDVCPDCGDPSKARDAVRMQALMQALALVQEQAQMVARRPPESVILQSAEHAAQLDAVDLRLLREGHDSAEVGVESAIRIVNATSTELSRIMGDVQVAPTGAKQALLVEAETLGRSEEYLRARRLLQSLSPSVFGVDPVGGMHMG